MSTRKIVTAKGTSTLEIEVGSLVWTGKEFIKFQEEQLGSLPKEFTMSLGKGTGKIIAAKYPKSIRKDHKGGVLIVAKGTKSIKRQ